MENKTKKYFLENIWQDLNADAIGEVVILINLRQGSFRAITTIAHCPICEARLAQSKRVYAMKRNLYVKSAGICYKT